MLGEDQANLSSKWREQLDQRQISLLEDDISAAKRQISSLNSQIDSLKSQLADLTFIHDELSIKHDDIASEPQRINSDSPPRATFFTYLAQIENEEATLKSKIETQTQSLHDLTHQKNLLSQENKKWHQDFTIAEHRLSVELESSHKQNDILEQQLMEIGEKEAQLSDLSTKSDTLKEELEQRTNNLLSDPYNDIENYKKTQRELEDELQANLYEEDRLRAKLESAQREAQEKLQASRTGLDKVQSVKSWQAQRQRLLAELKNAKSQRIAEEKTLESFIKRESDLGSRFKAMLGEEDPGDGTGRKARQLLSTEIREIDEEHKSNEEFEAEKSYYEELTKKSATLSRSLEVLNGYTDSALGELDAELVNSSQDGYLKLLRREQGEMISIVGK